MPFSRILMNPKLDLLKKINLRVSFKVLEKQPITQVSFEYFTYLVFKGEILLVWHKKKVDFLFKHLFFSDKYEIYYFIKGTDIFLTNNIVV